MNKRDNAAHTYTHTHTLPVAQWLRRYNEKTGGACDIRRPYRLWQGKFHFYVAVYFVAATRLSGLDQRAMAFYY